MKKTLVILFLLTSFLGFGQSVSAPDPKTFIESTNGQDASGFVLNGFNSTDILLTSISLVTFPSGTTFYLNTTTGLTAASGFTLSGNKTRLVVTGTMDNINNALLSLKINTGVTKGEIKLSVGATINPIGFFYNGVNGHFYKPLTATVDRTTYINARFRSLQSTFKGQTGYLVTITSTSEEEFIRVNVPATNVWFAATDEVKDGTWVIDAGPEKGTVMKTSNGQLTGNIPGVYNNWCGGEPNGNNGSENYAVAKWNGASCWNDLSNNWNNPYVIEYGTWSNPDDQTFTEFYTNSVSNSNGDILRLQFNFDFGSNVDKTKFLTKMFTTSDNINYSETPNTSSKPLNGLGKVDMTNDIDNNTYPTGTKYINLTPGQIEFCVIYSYDVTNKRYRVGLDSRLWQYTPNAPIWNEVTNLQLFDLYNGVVVPNSGSTSTDVHWNEYWVYTDVRFDYDNSTYQSNLRNMGGGTNPGYALKLSSTFTFGNNLSYKQHSIGLSTTNNIYTFYDNIVTVSDVYLAFKELSNGGIFGNESGNEFTHGIQYMNADVNGDNQFNETDTYLLLQHLTGDGNNPLSISNSLGTVLKLIPQSNYNNITKQNWKTQIPYLRTQYPITFSPNTLNTYNVSISWKGDVNLSHSATPTSNSITGSSVRTMSLKSNSNTNEVNTIKANVMGENIGGKVIITLSVNPLQQELVGTQFQLNYDNTSIEFEKVEFTTKGNPTNFGTNRGSSIRFGSLVTDGGILDNTTEYKITFIPKIGIQSILGLTSFSSTDAVNKSGVQLKVKLQ